MAKSKKQRRDLYKKWINNIALDISQSAQWRQSLFSSNYGQRFLVNSTSEFYFPKLTKPFVTKHNLQFYVSKVLKCPIKYLVEDGCTIFKFQSVEFPEIVQYSGN